MVWPIHTGEMTTWNLSGETLLELSKQGFVRVRKARGDLRARPWTIAYVKAGNRKKVVAGEIVVEGREKCGAFILADSTRNSIPKTTWKVASHDARLYGTTMLRTIPARPHWSLLYPKVSLRRRETLSSDSRSPNKMHWFSIFLLVPAQHSKPQQCSTQVMKENAVSS